jgi:hypothetical protein
MAGDVAALIETLALDRPVVIGRLHGGLIAYHLTASRPELIRGLILGDTPPEVTAQRAETALALIRSLPARFASLDEVIAYYQETLLLSEARARHDIPYDLVQDEGNGYRWRHDLALVERIEAASLPRADWDVLARIACPTLLLRGQRGEVPTAMAERVCQTIAICEAQTVLGARHDVFLGPGCEQAFGAIDLFLMRLRDRSGRSDNGAGPTAGAAAPIQVVERIVRAVNSRDAEAVTALFAPHGRIIQYGEGGRVREGGIETARAAFGRIFAGSQSVVMEAHDLIAQNDRIACVFAVHDATPSPAVAPAVAILAPAFLRIDDGRITEFISYNLHVPADQIS